MFAVDHTHGILAAWLANRNALMAAAFGAMTLFFHDRWRRDRASHDALFAAVALAIGLCSGESASRSSATSPRTRRSSIRARRASAARARAVRARAARVRHRLSTRTLRLAELGDVRRSRPVAAQVRSRVFENGPLLVGTELGVPAVDLYPFLPTHLSITLFVVCARFIVLAALPLYAIVKRDRVMRFFVVGALLSVVPFCATIPWAPATHPVDRDPPAIAACSPSVGSRPPGRTARSGRRDGHRRVGGLGHIVLSPPALLFSSSRC